MQGPETVPVTGNKTRLTLLVAHTGAETGLKRLIAPLQPFKQMRGLRDVGVSAAGCAVLSMMCGAVPDALWPHV